MWRLPTEGERWFGEVIWKTRCCILKFASSIAEMNFWWICFLRMETMIITGALLRCGCITVWPGVGLYRSDYSHLRNKYHIYFHQFVSVFCSEPQGTFPRNAVDLQPVSWRTQCMLWPASIGSVSSTFICTTRFSRRTSFLRRIQPSYSLWVHCSATSICEVFFLLFGIQCCMIQNIRCFPVSLKG